ncbi:MAG: hypothetical protein HY962_07025 [Ignavibacteriae bacterium]|nr:hypothetical protein [Ignavibacteriota bacterium]
MVHPDILRNVRIEDLPDGDVRRIAERCGLEVALSLVEGYSGLTIYIPRNTLHGFVRRYVRENHRRLSPKELALALNVTVSHVYSILRENGMAQNQASLFESEEKAA